MEKDARSLACSVLTRISSDGAYSTLSLREALAGADLPDPRDVSLATALVYGVTERRETLDYNLSLYLKQPLRKLPPQVLSVLRLGAYQLLFSDKIPAAAAVNESVKLVRRGKFSYAAGLVNAVLRRIAAAGLALPDETDKLRYLSVRYSVPAHLVTLLTAAYGEETARRLLESFLEPKPVFIRRNALKCTREQLIASLAAENVGVRETALQDAFALERPGDITRLSAFRDGWFFVQDLSAQLAAETLGAKPGDRVIDCCAAPGGKSFAAAAAMENRGEVVAADLYPHKCALIEAGAKRLGITNLQTICADARALPGTFAPADRVLCDAPCSGLGVMGRKPEIRYQPPETAAALPALQLEILSAGAKLVKPGGTLVYSTCTLNPAENEGVCRAFLAAHPDFALSRDETYLSRCKNGFITCLPFETEGDGFFIAKFIKTV